LNSTLVALLSLGVALGRREAPKYPHCEHEIDVTVGWTGQLDRKSLSARRRADGLLSIPTLPASSFKNSTSERI
jgi:hypothetical protein